MNIGMLLPFIIIIAVMFVMTRSAKNKQRQVMEMRDRMEPGSGVRTIGGMYAIVKEVHDDTVLLEVADGVHAHFAKNAVGAVLDLDEYHRIVHGIEPAEAGDTPVEKTAGVPGDAGDRVDLRKSEAQAGQPEDGPKTDDGDSK